MIMDFVIPRSDEGLLEAYERYRMTADEKVCCDYALHVAVTKWNAKVCKCRRERERLSLDFNDL